MKATFVEMDVHKKTIQVCGMDKNGMITLSGNVQHNMPKIKNIFYNVPKTKIVMELSSVWIKPFFYLCNELRYDVTLSNRTGQNSLPDRKKRIDWTRIFLQTYILENLLYSATFQEP